MVRIKEGIKVDPKCVVSKQKCIDNIEKWPFMVIFLYNLYFFFWIQYGCLANMVFTLDPSKCYNEVMVYILQANIRIF